MQLFVGQSVQTEDDTLLKCSALSLYERTAAIKIISARLKELRMSNLQSDELTSRLQRLERQNRWTALGGLAVLGLLAVGTYSGSGEPQTQPARFGSIEVERIMFVDSDGKVRAELGVQDGPFLVIDRIPSCGAFAGHISMSWERHERIVPPFHEITGALLEQIASNLACEPNDVLRMLRRDHVPVLVLSDTDGKPRAILATTEIDPTDPQAERKLRGLRESQLGRPQVNPKARR